MALSLVDSASIGQLPDHQFMDLETLDWVASQEAGQFPDRPAYDAVSEFRTSVRDILSRYCPLPEWYATPNLNASIHGVRHTLRVITLAHALNALTVYPEVFVAASLHDLRRLNDRGDPQHGERAAEWWVRNQESILDRFGLGPVNVENVYHAIRLHEIPYPAFTAHDRNVYETTRLLIDTLKAADALDRYRLPKTKWWIDDAKIVLRPNRPLKRFAFHLMIESERRFLAGANAIDAVHGGICSILNTNSESDI